MAADGRIDGTVVKRNSHDWDLAAADLILERAGGQLVDLHNSPLAYNRASVTRDMLVAGSEHAISSLLPRLRDGSAG
jgi:myo-inositol-1(or 4)-monophosphatase